MIQRKKKYLLFIITVIQIYVFQCNFNINFETDTIIQPEFTYITNTITNKFSPAWSPDGSKMIYGENSQGIHILSISNDLKFDTLHTIFNNCISGKFDISHDCNHIVYSSKINKNIQILSLKDSSTISISINNNTLYNPTFSPDEDWIVFDAYDHNSGETQIWISSVEGCNLNQVTSTEISKICREPCWSSDENGLGFSALTNNQFQIYTLIINEKKYEQLTYSKGNHIYPSWSPDNSKIVFVYINFPYTSFTLGIVKTETLEESYFEKLNFKRILYPSWSSDNKIIFWADHAIWTVTNEGEELTKLIDIYDDVPALWFEDDFIIYNNFMYTKLCLINFDRNISKTLYKSDLQNVYLNPKWFDNDHFFINEGSKIIKMNINGSEIIPITEDNDLRIYHFDISHDRKKLIFHDENDIFLQDQTNGKVINVSKDIEESLYHPAWSPDGKYIVCSSSVGLKIFFIENDHLFEILTIPGLYSDPEWSNVNKIVGSHIVVESGQDIYTISPKDWKANYVVQNSRDPCWFPDGIKIAFINNNNISIMKVFQELK